MNSDYGALTGAAWIGGKQIVSNPMSLDRYIYKLKYKIISGSSAGIVIGARNKDNYTLAEISNNKLCIYDVCDNAWTNAATSRTVIASCQISDMREENSIEIQINDHKLTVVHNDEILFYNDELFPRSDGFTPYKCRLMMIGFYQPNNTVQYWDIQLGEEKAEALPCSRMSLLGKWENGVLTVSNNFEIASVLPVLMLRKSFNGGCGIKKAVLYASARGFYNAYINGRRIGDMYYAPGFTDYRLRIPYQSYDVTNLISAGENKITAEVGSGYYSGFAGYNRFANVYGTEISFIARLVIEYENGRNENILTDGSWDFADNCAALYADYLHGEYFDAREKPIWRRCDIMPSPQLPVPTNGKRHDLAFHMEEDNECCAREVMRLEGKYIGEAPLGHRIYDMGQNMVGTARIRLRGARGNGVKLRYGEMLLKTGELYTANLRAAANTDVYVLNGCSTGEEFIPDLTAHGFRYLEITGNGCKLDGVKIESVTGIVISNVQRITGGFECSNTLINRLYSNIVWGQRGNFLLVPTDCPQRNERMGWTGDAQVFAKTAAYNMDVYSFMRKWLKDMREAQLMFNCGGSVPDIVPLCGDNRGGCAGWADAAVIVPWELYRAYGKKEILEENYSMMKAWVDFQNSEANRGNGQRTVKGKKAPSDLAETPYIQNQQRRGDHLAFDKSTPFILSATAYAAHSAEILADTACALGIKDDEDKYRALYNNIKNAFCEAWIEEDGTLSYWGEMSFDEVNRTYFSDLPGSVHHPSQTAYALAIDFGLIDINKYPRAAQCFKRTLEDRNGRLSVGFLGISHLAPALSKCGYVEEAFRLLEQTENPGWLYSVINGATTIWERWDSYIAENGRFADPSMNSFNHYAYGAIGEWMFGEILGINAKTPGYSSVELTPHYGGSMSWAKGYHITPYGRIDVSWKLEDGLFKYECSLPPRVEGKLIMPTGAEYKISGRFKTECALK